MHCFTFVLNFVRYVLGKTNGRCECFYTWELNSPTFCWFFVCELCRFLFFFVEEISPDIIKDANSAKMSGSLAIAEVLIERKFFTFSPCVYLLAGSQGYSIFLLDLLIDYQSGPSWMCADDELIASSNIVILSVVIYNFLHDYARRSNQLIIKAHPTWT